MIHFGLDLLIVPYMAPGFEAPVLFFSRQRGSITAVPFIGMRLKVRETSAAKRGGARRAAKCRRPPPTLSKHLYKMTLCKWPGWRVACKTSDTCFLCLAGQHPAASHRRPPGEEEAGWVESQFLKIQKNNQVEGKKIKKKNKSQECYYR